MDLIFATSKAGHDKGQTYLVLNEVGDYFILVNGDTKTLAKPKKKKKIHLQIVKKLPEEVIEIIDEIASLDDVSIKRILKVYNRRNKNV